MLLADHFQVLVVTVAKTFIFFVGILPAMFVLVLLDVDVFTDFNCISLQMALFADNGITGGVEVIVEKITWTDQMSSIGNHLHACDVLFPVKGKSKVEEFFISDLRDLGKIQSQTIEGVLNCEINMTMI